MNKKSRLFCLLLSLPLFLISAPNTVFAGRPLTVDDADPIEVKQIQFEAGFAYFSESGNRHHEWPFSLSYGLVPGLEFGVGLGGLLEERTEAQGEKGSVSGIGDLSVSAKWLVMERKDRLPALALVPTVKFPTADKDDGLGSGEIDYDATLILSEAISEKIGAHLNLGYSWIGEPEHENASNLLHFGVAGDYQIMEPIQLVAEVFCEEEIESGEDLVVEGNFGLRYEATAGLLFDLAAGSNLQGKEPDFTATLGLTWLFGGESTKGEG